MRTLHLSRPLLPLLLAAALAGVSHAATTDIAQVPLVTSAPNAVLPNLMFILDDSGSMDWDYLPDLVDDARCRSSGATGTSSGNFGQACQNEPPYRSSSYNGVYYNPAITYLPPLYANGTSWPSQTSANTGGWTGVKNDAYGIQSTATTNLVTGYPDVRYCTDTGLTDCLRNGNYVLPGTVNSKNYTTRDNTTASGSGYLAVGAPDSPSLTAQQVNFGPHYYVINPGEYCDAPNLRNCQTTANTVFKYAAPVRWCTTNANARAAVPAAGSCQALNTPTYNNLRIPTKFFTAGTAGSAAVAEVRATASFRVNNIGCNTTVTQVNVSGVGNILSAATSPATNNRDTLGAYIAARINSGSSGYTATTCRWHTAAAGR